MALQFYRAAAIFYLMVMAGLASAAEPAPQKLRIDIPDVEVVDQDGRAHRFPDLVAGRRVAMNFVFTTCTTICVPLGATFGKLRTLLGERAGKDVHLISVSVDPANDAPARLKQWSEKFGAGPGWTLVTGRPPDVNRLLKALGVFTADRRDHAPLVLIGTPTGEWTRAYGLASPAQLAALLEEPASPAPPPAAAPGPSGENGAAHRYFTDTVLVDQDGREHRFYRDLLQGRTVVMDFVFTRCTGVCPVLGRALGRIQAHLGDRVGRDVFLLSFSVDPAHDTPDRLKEYARRVGARPGWLFLTGPEENVRAVLRVLGQWVDDPAQHQNLLLIGNDRTGLWKKAFGLAPPADLLAIVDSVANDEGASQGGPGGDEEPLRRCRVGPAVPPGAPGDARSAAPGASRED